MLDFVVVKEDNPYQIILGRLFLRISKPVNGMVGVVKGDQRVARSYYTITAKETM